MMKVKNKKIILVERILSIKKLFNNFDSRETIETIEIYN